MLATEVATKVDRQLNILVVFDTPLGLRYFTHQKFVALYLVSVKILVYPR
jgi:hypothetical protein